MPGLIKDAKTAVNNLKNEFSTLKGKVLSVNASICNLSDVVSSISASVRTQEDKADALETFREENEEFIEEAVRIDEDVADKVNQGKEDFYDKYSYLKPDCEKSRWEKFKEGCKKVIEWCLENWVAIVTVIVVVAVAIVALACGVAVAAVAAIAGLIGLVLCVADIICMIATGGKSIADLCNENGLGWLGQIFSGLSFGCDLVAILLPIGAAIKSIAKVGIISFAKGAWASLKASFKEMIEAVWTKGFKTGFKNGVKNTFNLLFKTFIFDVDDISRIDNGKRIFDFKADVLPERLPNTGKDGYWDLVDGKYYPRDSAIPADKRYNPDGLSMKQLFDQECAKLGIDIDHIPTDKYGNPDFNVVSAKNSKIKMKNMDIDYDNYLQGKLKEDDMGDIIRNINFKNADADLAKRNNGMKYKSLQESLDVKLTRHETFNMKRVNYVPTAIHANLAHNGGVSRLKFLIKQIPGQPELIIRNMTRSIIPITRFVLDQTWGE